MIKPKLNQITPSSVGTRADMIAGVNIGKVHGGYFSNQEVAQAFVTIGILPIQKNLPINMRYADYGGGTGVLAKSIIESLEISGHSVNAVVIDSNTQYLHIAENAGLKTMNCNLEDCDFSNTDLITMRAVNHYNTPHKQVTILKKALSSLKPDGYLISQISSGSEKNCRLRSEIVNLKSLDRAAKGEYYHWTSIDEYTKFLKEAGFRNIQFMGNAPECHWSPEEQWDRFHSKETIGAQRNHDIKKLHDIESRKKAFLNEAYEKIKLFSVETKDDHSDIQYDEEGHANIYYQYPVILSQK